MTRLAISAREDMAEDVQHFFDRIIRDRGQVAGPYSVLLNSPDVAARIAYLGNFILYETALAPRVQYVTMLVAARALDCTYVWESVLPRAEAAGVPLPLIDALRRQETPTEMTAEEELLLRFCRKLLTGNHHVDDATYQAVIEHFGTSQAIQISYTVGYVVMMGFIANAFDVEHDSNQQELIL